MILAIPADWLLLTYVTGVETEAQKGKSDLPRVTQPYFPRVTRAYSWAGCCRRHTLMTAWEKEGQVLAEERALRRACCEAHGRWVPYSILPPQHCWSFFPVSPPVLVTFSSTHRLSTGE